MISRCFPFQSDDCSSKGTEGQKCADVGEDTFAGLLGMLSLWISLGAAAVPGCRCLVITVLLLPEMRSHGEAGVDGGQSFPNWRP